ncbi:MAG: hypothetical protein VX589_08935 [Myxococcota bacterium]|nr:hypothetical protein [Myxococcota bacterium]
MSRGLLVVGLACVLGCVGNVATENSGSPAHRTAGTMASMMDEAGGGIRVAAGLSSDASATSGPPTGGFGANSQSPMAGQQNSVRDRAPSSASDSPMGGQLEMAMVEPMSASELDGPPCDPRERARACDPGWFCHPLPNGGGYRGRCQPGDGCTPGTNDGCSAEQPYCHLRGGATMCMNAGLLEAGQPCVDADGVPQPCIDGLVCNHSVCQTPCVPDESNECPYEGRCISLQAATGILGGLCGPRHCNWFTGDLCENDQKCNYSIRSDGVLVGACGPLVATPKTIDEPCEFLPGGGDNCESGLACVGPPDGLGKCRILCDTGQYERPCPRGQSCKEILRTRQGVVRGYGLCTLNR